jgi:hypothetical protein
MMSRFVRGGICALGVAVAGVGFAGTADASMEDSSWAIYNDGCGYLTDGYASYQAACPRADGGWNFYVADSGQWSYVFSALTDVYGCTTAWSDAGTIGSSCVQGWLDPMGYVGGGGSMLTGNPVIDAIMTETNNAIITTWLSPTCIEIVGDVCYT